jgi:hypothetical protein
VISPSSGVSAIIRVTKSGLFVLIILVSSCRSVR